MMYVHIYVHMYICTYVAVTLRNVDQCCRFPACGFLASEVLACRFLAGCLSFINQEDDTRFSTLKINLQASACCLRGMQS